MTLCWSMYLTTAYADASATGCPLYVDPYCKQRYGHDERLCRTVGGGWRGCGYAP
jgi:hypothetical protein